MDLRPELRFHVLMESYGQFCPVAKASQLVCQRWTPLIIRDLSLGPLRFSELQRGVPTMSPTLLSRRLKELEAEGVVERVAGQAKTKAYRLTTAGLELLPVVELLGIWGQRWTRRTLEREEQNLTLFLWAFERSINPSAFRRQRTLVEMLFRDQPAAKKRWWFLNEGGTAHLCIDAPAHDADLYVSSTLPTMIRIWRGDESLSDALEAGSIEVHGAAVLMRCFNRWFGVSTLAHVRSEL